jgi:hypothetical protein
MKKAWAVSTVLWTATPAGPRWTHDRDRVARFSKRMLPGGSGHGARSDSTRRERGSVGSHYDIQGRQSGTVHLGDDDEQQR